MCVGIALPLDEFPLALRESPDVRSRTYLRAGLEEVRFFWWQTPSLLPVHWNGRLRLLAWGSRSRRSRLPLGGWVPEERIGEGAYAGATPMPVTIPALLGHDAGMWYATAVGIRGVIFEVESGPVVYMLTRRSTNYYRNITEQTPRMPVLVEQVI